MSLLRPFSAAPTGLKGLSLSLGSLGIGKVLNSQFRARALSSLPELELEVVSSDSASAPAAKASVGASKSVNERMAPLRDFLGKDFSAGDVLRPSREIVKDLLTVKDQRIARALFAHANTVSERFFKNLVYFRGIVEFSNVCQKDCYYCGIRKHMKKVNRYTMKKDEILDCAVFAHESKYGTLMLQSGELPTEERLAFVEDVVRSIREKTMAMDEAQGVLEPKGLAVALSIGELPIDEYVRMKDAGAARFLLRIETSNPDLYKELHPADHSWHNRRDCLADAQKAGLQIGTGVMIGLPGQTIDDLAGDLEFFRDMNVDMIGMGPYVIEEDTPLGKIAAEQGLKSKEDLLELCMRMVALARITLGDVNIAATTALETLHPLGREMALQRGANVVMPIMTPMKYRESYQLYAGKPCIDEDAVQCRSCLDNRVRSVGKVVAYGIHGDPPSFNRRAADIQL